MFYTINVALKGQHYFGTSEHSLRALGDAQSLVHHFVKLFPDSEGYSVTLYEGRHSSKVVEFCCEGAEILNDNGYSICSLCAANLTTQRKGDK